MFVQEHNTVFLVLNFPKCEYNLSSRNFRQLNDRGHTANKITAKRDREVLHVQAKSFCEKHVYN